MVSLRSAVALPPSCPGGGWPGGESEVEVPSWGKAGAGEVSPGGGGWSWLEGQRLGGPGSGGWLGLPASSWGRGVPGVLPELQRISRRQGSVSLEGMAGIPKLRHRSPA